MISVAAVATAANIADLGTKRLPCHTMRKLMYMVGVYNGSEKVGAEEYEQCQQKKLIKGVMQMTTGGGRASSLQLALLMAMFPNALGSRVGGTSIFWRSSVEIPIWFMVLILHHTCDGWNLCREGDQGWQSSNLQLERSMQ